MIPLAAGRGGCAAGPRASSRDVFQIETWLSNEVRSSSSGPVLSGIVIPVPRTSQRRNSQRKIEKAEQKAANEGRTRQNQGSHVKRPRVPQLGGPPLLGVISFGRRPLSDRILASITKMIIAMQLVRWASGWRGASEGEPPSHIRVDDEAITHLQPAVTIAECCAS